MALKGVDSPRVSSNEVQTAQIENSEDLTSVESTLYRSLVMKLAYVAQDRVDIAAAVKWLTRRAESIGSRVDTCKNARGWVDTSGQVKRCVSTYARQTSDETLQVHVDSDWAERIAWKKEHDMRDRENELHDSC